VTVRDLYWIQRRRYHTLTNSVHWKTATTIWYEEVQFSLNFYDRKHQAIEKIDWGTDWELELLSIDHRKHHVRSHWNKIRSGLHHHPSVIIQQLFQRSTSRSGKARVKTIKRIERFQVVLFERKWTKTWRLQRRILCLVSRHKEIVFWKRFQTEKRYHYLKIAETEVRYEIHHRGGVRGSLSGVRTDDMIKARSEEASIRCVMCTVHRQHWSERHRRKFKDKWTNETHRRDVSLYERKTS
jgi:hypothetical protein